MATLTIPYGAQCDVSITNNYDTVGSLTRADIKPLTPTQAKALFTDGSQWHEMTALLRTQFEMKACGLKRDGMYEWIMTSNRPGQAKLINITRQQKGPSLIHPFIMGRQKSPVNDEYWVVDNGYATGSYTPESTGPLTAVSGTVNGYTVATGSRVLRLSSAYGVPLSAQYFLPGHFLYLLNLSTGGAALHGQWQILDAVAEDASPPTYIDVLVNIKGPDTTTVDATPTTGVVIIGPNSVYDVESYCRNRINVNNEKYVPFFYGTRRWGRRVSSEYRKMLQRLLEDNQWFAAFQDIPLSERNAQDQMRDQREWVNQFFFGRAVSSNQSLTGWGSLRQVLSHTNTALFAAATSAGSPTESFVTGLNPGTGGDLIAFEATPVGVYDQLKGCGQVADSQNQNLNIQDYIENTLYGIIRNRRQDGSQANELDIYTDTSTAGDFQSAFISYVKASFGDITRLNIEQGSNAFGFQWKKFLVPKRPFGLIINLITHNYFDDMLNTFSLAGVNQASRARFLAVLDLGKGGSVYPAILASNRKTWITGELQKLAAVDSSWACVMENPTIETSMTSVTSTTVVECPLKSHWQENFAGITMP